jgi:SNF2 family DNA or RNA helicase
MKFTPYDYQRDGVRLMIKQPAAGLLCWPGAGKTAISYSAFKILRSRNLVKRALIIAPKKPCYLVWPKELAKWDEFADLKLDIIAGESKTRDELVHSNADLHIINPESLDWLMRQRFVKWPWDMLIVDESSKFKNTQAQRFKSLKGVLGKFTRRYILTGTPAPNGLLDLFGQIYILDCGDALGKYITHYKMQYFEPSGYGGYEWRLRKWEDNEGAVHTSAEEIYEKIRPLVLRPDDTEYRKSLPPLNQIDVAVTLPPKAREIYNKLEDDLIAQIEDQEVSAINSAVASMKLRQVANGEVYADQDPQEFGTKRDKFRPTVEIHDAKLSALVDLVNELEGQPAFIAYEFQHELERLKKALGNPPHLAGGVSMKVATEVERKWNLGELPILLVQPQSVAHGLNLQGAGQAIIWYGLTWNLEDYEQLIQRIWRQGKVGSLWMYRLIATDTVDEDQVAALKMKARNQKSLLDALMRRRRKR